MSGLDWTAGFAYLVHVAHPSSVVALFVLPPLGNIGVMTIAFSGESTWSAWPDVAHNQNCRSILRRCLNGLPVVHISLPMAALESQMASNGSA